MVGSPKTLYDLRKVEGAIRLTCRACKRVNLLDREETILMRQVDRQSCDWPVFVGGAICPDCTSNNVKVQIEAFAEGLPEMRRRRAVMITLELALTILAAASYSGSAKAVPVEAVRLALRAIHPHLGDRAALEGFWTAYATREREVWESPVGALSDIVQKLLNRGYALPAELRMGLHPSRRSSR